MPAGQSPTPATPGSPSANPKPRNARVVVARPRALARRPVVHMHMLDLDAPAERDRGRDEDVVELLRVLVEQVRVALDGGHARERVDLEQDAVKGGEDGAGLAVLVAVPADDDVGGGVFGEDA